MRPIATILATWILGAQLAAANTNHCELTATGDTTISIKRDADGGGAQGKLGASTDYWLSEAQLRIAVGATASLGKKLGKDEQARKIDERMKQDPRFTLLLINCLTDEGGVSFAASSPSKYGDIPMKPASYPIVPLGSARPGEITASFHLSPGGKRERYAIHPAGKLVLTQFDKTAIAGTFTFTAEARGKAAKRVEVTGRFSYRCVGEACQK